MTLIRKSVVSAALLLSSSAFAGNPAHPFSNPVRNAEARHILVNALQNRLNTSPGPVELHVNQSVQPYAQQLRMEPAILKSSPTK
jgi:hypothetical protein